jgi:hypothetical protein
MHRHQHVRRCIGMHPTEMHVAVTTPVRFPRPIVILVHPQRELGDLLLKQRRFLRMLTHPARFMYSTFPLSRPIASAL